MHIIFALARLFPYWAFPLFILGAELAWYFHRKKSSAQFFFWTSSGIFLALIVCWLGFRGDLNADSWVRALFGG